MAATLGDNIRKARVAAGIKTQGALAKKLGVEQPQVSDWENDRYNRIELTNLLRIAAAIPCSLDDLVSGLHADYDARDLIRHGLDVQDGAPKGGPDAVADRRRIAELEQAIQGYETLLDSIEDVASRLIELAAGGPKGSSTARAASTRGRRHRKAG